MSDNLMADINEFLDSQPQGRWVESFDQFGIQWRWSVTVYDKVNDCYPIDNVLMPIDVSQLIPKLKAMGHTVEYGRAEHTGSVYSIDALDHTLIVGMDTDDTAVYIGGTTEDLPPVWIRNNELYCVNCTWQGYRPNRQLCPECQSTDVVLHRDVVSCDRCREPMVVDRQCESCGYQPGQPTDSE